MIINMKNISLRKKILIGVIPVFILAGSLFGGMKGNDMKNTNLENVRWDLSNFGYSSYKDNKIEADVKKIEALMADLVQYRGKVASNLAVILKKEIELDLLSNRVFGYLSLLSSQDEDNQELSKLMNDYGLRLSMISAELEFITLEIGEMNPSQYKRALASDDLVRFHKSMFDKTIENAKYNLSEAEEKILTKTGAFNSSPWGQSMNELDSRIKFNFDGEKMGMAKILNIMNNDLDDKKRADAFKVFAETLTDKGNGFSYLEMQAKTMNNIMGLGAVMRKERGLTYPMEGRNLSNMVSKEAVEALHNVAENEGKEQAVRYYKIIARLMGKDVLDWSDRGAKPLSVSGDNSVEWNEAVKMVLDTYNDFSPEMGEIAETFFTDGKVDAPIYQGKGSGAFSSSFMYANEDGEAQEFSAVLMNYAGTSRDVSTLAHEVGHSIHGILAERKQGALMNNAPLAYAETASTFGEMLLFENLLKKEDDKKEKLAMLLDKSGDWISTVVRQMSFSEFEQIIHNAREKGELLPEDFNDAYLTATKKYYGEEGDVFKYEGVAPLWAYVGHFRRPFYVYSYAFGELFSQSMFALKDNYKDGEFQKLYMDMLAKGNTEGAIDLMAPFGLNPEDREFWANGVKVSIEAWLDEAEKLMNELNL